ncbi:MAG: hypothetical protein K9W42_11120 [Candidatus Heimdallarchaeota archaeon]|nr:hypothetical protein [Candidatus Heimdallarchaeota archaeon]
MPPKDDCADQKKLLPCPVTQADKTEGAYPILQDKGNVWYCTNCFYCEDACVSNSARQHAIEKRRTKEQNSKEMREPLEQLKKFGTLFPISKELAAVREEYGLPQLPAKPVAEVAHLYEQILRGEEQPPPLPATFSKNRQASPLQTSIALFLGCLIPYRVLQYEKSARELLKQLEISFVDLPFVCCGSIMTESQSELLWLVSAAHNLAIAEERGITTILSLCGGCTGNLRRVNQKLLQEPSLLKKVNHYLATINKQYTGTVRIFHLSEFLQNKDLQERLKQLIEPEQNQQLAQLTVGTQVPCQVIRPAPTSPNASIGSNLLRNLLSLTAIKSKRYPFETLCCGSSMLIYNKEIAYAIGKKRIDSLKARSVNALILGCGNCSMMYTVHQREYNPEPLPTFFFTEILTFALGGENDALNLLLQEKVKTSQKTFAKE